jgi:perosamine synthetase
MIPIYSPYLPKNSLSYAHDAIDSGWISSRGKYIQIATEKLQELLNVKYVQLVNNGTSACHLVAKSLYRKLNLKEKHPILVPDNVYAAAWNAFLFDKDYELITVKTNLDTWNFDLDDLDNKLSMYPEASILVVHNIGNIINIPELQQKYPNTFFAEDNCEGFLGKYNNEYTGTRSFASAVSFFANKHITSGEGGAFLTNDEDSYLYAKCIQAQGQSNKRFIHNELGYNYRMTNIQAAILCGQLDIIDQITEMKNAIFERYRAALKDREDILMQKIEPNTIHSNWMFGVRIPGNINYELAEEYFKNAGIEIRPMFFPIIEHKYIVENPDVFLSDYSNAAILNRECFILPSFPELTTEEQGYILRVLEDYVKEER